MLVSIFSILQVLSSVFSVFQELLFVSSIFSVFQELVSVFSAVDDVFVILSFSAKEKFCIGKICIINPKIKRKDKNFLILFFTLVYIKTK